MPEDAVISWDGVLLTLSAPFSYPIELDLNHLPEAKLAEIFERVVLELNRPESTWDWFCPEQISEKTSGSVSAYSGKAFRAPSKRFPYLAIAKAQRTVVDEAREVLSDARTSLRNIELVIQDYGVGCLSFQFELTDRTITAECWTEILIELSERCGDYAKGILFDELRSFLSQAVAAGVPVSSALTSIVYSNPKERVDQFEPNDLNLHWFHSMIIAASETLPNEYLDEFSSDRSFFPDTQTYLDSSTRYKKGVLLDFRSRSVRSGLFFGWGNSFVASRAADPDRISDEVPALDVLKILQCYSCGLYTLNKEVLQTGIKLRSEPLSLSEAHKKSGELKNMSNRVDLFFSLMRDQKYSQSAFERDIWEGMSSAWKLSELRNDIGANLSNIINFLDNLREAREGQINRRITVAVTIITIASSAAILFSILDEVFSPSPNLEKVIIQLVVVSFLLVLSLLLFKTKR